MPMLLMLLLMMMMSHQSSSFPFKATITTTTAQALHHQKEHPKYRVLVTGATGYIAKHVILQLLNSGHMVKASMRNRTQQREEEFRNTMSLHVVNDNDDHTIDLDRQLSVVELDLMSDDGWFTAMKDIDVLMHIASPVPSKEPKDPYKDVIRPAIEGTMRALKFATECGVRRVVATSSVAAIVNADLPPGRTKYNENDWTNINKPGVSAYVKSKTLAEKAMWDYCKNHTEMKATTILPAFVLGPPLDSKYGSSIRQIEKLLNNTTTPIPNYGYCCVDVRDIAMMHLKVLEMPSERCVGKRLIGSAPAPNCFIWKPEMAQILHDKYYPTHQISTCKSPNWLIHAKAILDPSLRYVATNLDKRREFDISTTQQILGMAQFYNPRHSLLETADYLIDLEERKKKSIK